MIFIVLLIVAMPISKFNYILSNVNSSSSSSKKLTENKMNFSHTLTSHLLQLFSFMDHSPPVKVNGYLVSQGIPPVL